MRLLPTNITKTLAISGNIYIMRILTRLIERKIMKTGVQYFLVFASVFALIMLANADVLGLQTWHTKKGEALVIEAEGNAEATVILAESNGYAIEKDADTRYMIADETQTRANREQLFGFVHQPVEDAKWVAGYGKNVMTTLLCAGFAFFVISIVAVFLKSATDTNRS